MAGRQIYVHDDGDEAGGFKDLQVPVWSEDRQRWEARHVPISVGGGTGAVPGPDPVPENIVTSDDITEIVQITQAAYDALDPPVATTLYVIVG